MFVGINLGINQLRSSTSITPFSPASLFASNEPGVWYDPSDISTLFQDTAGTIPVTSPGQTPAQTVALMLDKSKGLTLGPELVTNGDFSSSANWTLTGTLSAISAGALRLGDVSTAATASQSGRTFTSGKSYRVSFDVVSRTTGSVRIYFGAGAVAPTTAVSAVGSYSFIVSMPSNQTEIYFQTQSNPADLVVDNISVKELAGNHATQATAASRPTYGVVPTGGRRNIYNFSEDFSNTYWSKGNLTATAASINETATNTTHQLAANSGTNTANVPNTLSFEVKPNGRSYINVSWANSGSHYAAFNLSGSGSVISNQLSGIGTIILLPDGYYRITYTNTPTIAGAGFYGINLADGPYPTIPLPSYLGDVTKGVFIRNAQLETGSTATAYQKVTTQYDVTEAGVTSCPYLFFDGTSDAMATSTITPGIDKAQVFVGVRKVGPTASSFGVIVESSAIVDSNAGSLFVLSGSFLGTQTQYSSLSRGNATVSASQGAISTASFTAPVTNVLTSQHNIAGDLSSLRIDGVANGTNGTGDQGTGNFLAYPLYLGGRGGTTLFLNGQIFSLIVRFGANLASTTINSTEYWVGDKTGINIANNISTTIFARDDTAVLDRANSIIERRA
jgi:hypothetical protein